MRKLLLYYLLVVNGLCIGLFVCMVVLDFVIVGDKFVF